MTAGMTFFLRSGLPFLTEHRNISPTEPRGYLFNFAPNAVTEMTYKFLAPVLSAQFMMVPTYIPADILSLVPLLPPLPITKFYFIIALPLLLILDSTLLIINK